MAIIHVFLYWSVDEEDVVQNGNAKGLHQADVIRVGKGKRSIEELNKSQFSILCKHCHIAALGFLPQSYVSVCCDSYLPTREPVAEPRCSVSRMTES